MQTRTESEVRARILEIALELAPRPGAEATSEALLVDHLEYHSLALLELAFALEDEFDIEPIDEASARNIRTVEDIANYVLGQLANVGDQSPAGSHH